MHDEDTTVCYFCGKTGHMTSRCRDHSKECSPNPFMTNTEGPKKIWVPKKMIFPVVVVLDNKKQMPAMVPIQWLLTTYDERKLCVPLTNLDNAVFKVLIFS